MAAANTLSPVLVLSVDHANRKRYFLRRVATLHDVLGYGIKLVLQSAVVLVFGQVEQPDFQRVLVSSCPLARRLLRHEPGKHSS